MPDYQKTAVESFLKNHPPPYPTTLWNATGSRAFPDLSANGYVSCLQPSSHHAYFHAYRANYVVAVDGVFERVFGTSASSPVTASILSAVNDARLAIGKKPIGFINPTVSVNYYFLRECIRSALLQIYSSAFQGAFNDITNGTNPGCGTEGFSAVSGWDPVTGLGTPNFPKLLARWLLLP